MGQVLVNDVIWQPRGEEMLLVEIMKKRVDYWLGSSEKGRVEGSWAKEILGPEATRKGKRGTEPVHQLGSEENKAAKVTMSVICPRILGKKGRAMSV